MKSKNKLEYGWMTKAEMARVFKVTPQQFDRQYRRYVEPDAQQEIDGKLYFLCRNVLDAWAASSPNATKPKQPAEPEVDPLMAGPATEWLEVYRKHRAGQEEIKLEQMRGNMVPLADAEKALLPAAGILRRAGEQLARQYGNDAASLHNDAVRAWVRVVEKLFGTREQSDAETVPARI